MSRTYEEILARFNELDKEFEGINIDSEQDKLRAQEILMEMNELADEKDALRAAELAKELREYEVERITDEILRHEFIGKGFNIVCKCGYIGKEVSKKHDMERHIAESLIAAGWSGPRPDPWLDTRNQHPGEDWS